MERKKNYQYHLLLSKNFFFLFMVASVTYGSSQARGQIRAVAVSLCHSHGNARSEPHLLPMLQLAATTDP